MSDVAIITEGMIPSGSVPPTLDKGGLAYSKGNDTRIRSSDLKSTFSALNELSNFTPVQVRWSSKQPYYILCICDINSDFWKEEISTITEHENTCSRQVHSVSQENTNNPIERQIYVRESNLVLFSDSYGNPMSEELKDLESKLIKLKGEFRSSANQCSVANAIQVASVWPSYIPVPTLDIDEDGILYFFNFDANGNSLAGLEFLAKDSKVAYTILQTDHKDFDCGVLNSNSSEELSKSFFEVIRNRWENKVVG